MIYVARRGVARAIKLGSMNENFGHALYFSEDLLLPPPPNYFLIDFKEVPSTNLAKSGALRDHDTDCEEDTFLIRTYITSFRSVFSIYDAFEHFLESNTG